MLVIQKKFQLFTDIFENDFHELKSKTSMLNISLLLTKNNNHVFTKTEIFSNNDLVT